MSALRLPLALPALACVACTQTGVDGLVSGAPVAVTSATYAELPGAFGSDGAILVYLTGTPDPCVEIADWLLAGSAGGDPAALAGAWSSSFPPAFWEIDLVLRVTDPHANQQGEWILGVPWDENTDATDEVFAEIVQNRKARDAAFWDGTAPTEDYATLSYSDLGLLVVRDHAPGRHLSGVFSTRAADPETGAAEGDLEIRFEADRCAGIEQVLSR